MATSRPRPRPPALYIDAPLRTALAFVAFVLLFAAAAWAWMVVLG